MATSLGFSTTTTRIEIDGMVIETTTRTMNPVDPKPQSDTSAAAAAAAVLDCHTGRDEDDDEDEDSAAEALFAADRREFETALIVHEAALHRQWGSGQ
jgi:hypothetical protein